MTTAIIGPRAPFRYTRESDTWWWSDDAYRIFGFAPGEVLPTTDLIRHHLHPDDAEQALDLVQARLSQRQDFCVWHRIVDARRKVHQLLTIGEAVHDRSGRWLAVEGSHLDVTRMLRMSYGRDVDDAVRAAARTRGTIEQAKGVLMLTERMGGEQAFEVLRRCSQVSNIKVRELAAAIMAAVAETGQLPSVVREHLGGVHHSTIPARMTDVDLRDGWMSGPDVDPVG